MTAAVARSLAEVEPAPSVVTIGFFDGVHLGHQAIVARAVSAARAAGTRAVGVTFDRHPSELLRPESQPALLMTLERRVRTLQDLGLDLVLVLPFTAELSQVSAAQFIDEVLAAGTGAVHVVIGPNFRFGHRAQGNAALLAEVGATAGFTVDAVGLVDVDGEQVSSTRIRRLIADGDVAAAAVLLGRPHVLDGTVVPGEGRGRTIGVPTANLDLNERLQIPASGVYAAFAQSPGIEDGAPMPSVVNVGTRPTFGGQRLTVEAHLLDRDHDLYGRALALSWLDRLRAERRFDGPEALVEQIHRDIAVARDRLARPG